MQSLNSSTVLDALIDFEQLTGQMRPRSDAFEDLEKVVQFLDPRSRDLGVTGHVEFGKIMTALDMEPKTVTDVDEFLNTVHADLQSLLIFKVVPVRRTMLREFLTKWFDFALARNDDHFRPRRLA